MNKLTTVRFYGHLRKRFGHRFDYDIASPSEAIRALCATLPGFKEYMGVTHAQSPFRVIVGGQDKAVDELHDLTGNQEIRIVPAAKGAKSDGVQMIIGAVLTVVGAFTYNYGGNYLVNIGIAMLAGGVADWLASPPNPDAYGAGEEKRSYLFNGSNLPPNGPGCVPVLYGELEIQPILISGGISPEKVSSNPGLGGDGTGAWFGDGLTTALVASIAEAS